MVDSTQHEERVTGHHLSMGELLWGLLVAGRRNGKIPQMATRYDPSRTVALRALLTGNKETQYRVSTLTMFRCCWVLSVVDIIVTMQPLRLRARTDRERHGSAQLW